MSDKFLKIGHRGAMGYEPENTLASVQKAIDLGCDMVEIDVHLCKTGELVVIHDETLDRTTNGIGEVKNHSLTELKTLDAGNGEKIPTLNEVLDLINIRVKINIELKGIGTSLAVAKTIKSYIKNGWDSNLFYVSSFNHIELMEFKKLMPQIKLGALIYHLPFDLAQIGVDLGVFSINVSNEFLSQELINDAHIKGLKIFVYTVNKQEDIAKIKLMGVDGIFSNYPDRLQ